jgi:glycosyltransferase involved in cell wall biosynthesis
MDNPKILYVIGQLGRGGAEHQLYYLIKYLKPQAKVVSLSQGGWWADPIRGLGVDVIELQRRSSWDFSRLIALVKIIQKYEPEILHIFLDTVPGLYGRLAALLTRHACIISDERVETAVQQPYWYRMLKRLMNHQVAAVVTNSESNYLYLAGGRIASKEKLSCIHNGIELDRFVEKDPCIRWAQLRGGTKNKLVVGTVGNLFPVKAPDCFVRVAARVLARFPECCFVHVGDGPLRDEMENLSQQLGLQGSLFFLGTRNDVPRLLEAVDVFVLTSRSEGMPNALMEAMAAGLPCVVTDVGDCRMLVRDGQRGFVVPADDEPRLTDRILTLLQHGHLRIRFGLRGRDYIQRFDVRRMAEQYGELYQNVLNMDHAPKFDM